MEFDVLVIGSGPGGYVCAIKASQLGLKVGIIEKDEKLGGTCLNVGCIPSKALLESSEHYYKLNHEFQTHGIEVGEKKLNFSQMMNRKDKIVGELNEGISYLMKKNKIQVFHGFGKLLSPHEVIVEKSKLNHKRLKTKNIVLATGSSIKELKDLPFDGKKILHSTDILSLKEIPRSLAVIGAGAIGLEMASFLSRLGTKVHIIEYQKHIASGCDLKMSQKYQKILEKQNLSFLTKTKLLSHELKDNSVLLHLEKKSEKVELQVEKVLVAVGRKAFNKKLQIEDLGIEKNEREEIKVDSSFRTSLSNIYAIGDLIGGSMLAHKAEEEGVCVAEIIAGEKSQVHYKALPYVIYTDPELAYVGKTEEKLKEENIPYSVGQFPFAANGRAKAMNQTEGLVKVLACKKTDEILGVHIIGARASEFLSEAISMMEFEASAEDMARSFHSHPSLSEALREASLDVSKKARQF